MHEIAYSINSPATLEQGYLVLDLLERIKEGSSYCLRPYPKGQSLSDWRKLIHEEIDKELFAFLIKEELQFQSKQTGKLPKDPSIRFFQIHIPPSQILKAFKLLSSSPRLYHQEKELLIDIYSPVKFYYEADSLPTGELMIKGKLQGRNFELELSASDVVVPGRPSHWFMHGMTLKMIQPSPDWKRLKELKHSPILLKGTAKQTFLDELELDGEDSPLMILKEGSLSAINQDTAPFPELLLKDRWGACADLWMNYGNGQLVAVDDLRLAIKDPQGKPLFKRQFEVESSWEKDLLETSFVKKMVGTSHYYCPLDQVGKSLTFLLEVGWNIKDWQNRTVLKQSGLDLQFDENNHSISVKGHLSFDNFKADLSDVVGAFNRRDNFVQLSPTTTGLLPSDDTQHALRDLSEESEWIGSVCRLKKTHMATLAALWPYARTTHSLIELKDKLENFNGIQEALPGSTFSGTLRPYQQQGVNWLAFLHQYGFHGILADEMGLGKTVQILAFLSRVPQNRPHLIVVPTSLLFNWKNEVSQFLPSLTCLIHQGLQRTQSAEVLQKVNIILISYATLRMDISLFQSIHYGCLILDEAQAIKNANTQTAQTVCSLNAELRISVTGTPMENRLEELWSHFHFLIPDLLGNLESFEADIQASRADSRYMNRIRKKIAPFFLRRLKQDVAADLPERINQIVWVDMSDEQRTFYEHLLAGFKNGLLKKIESDGINKHRMEIFEALLRLRQACCHPLLVSKFLDEMIPPSAKFEALFDDLETIVQEKHKVLVYSQFTSMLTLMTRTAKERQWSFGYLDGNTKNREEVVTRFQNDPSQFIFFISLKAGGVGLNLTKADYVYLYDPWWNDAVEEQAINRAHRIGRKDTVIAKQFVIRESIEEKMMRLKSAKRLLIDDLFNENFNSNQLTQEDLQFLLT